MNAENQNEPKRFHIPITVSVEVERPKPELITVSVEVEEPKQETITLEVTVFSYQEWLRLKEGRK